MADEGKKAAALAALESGAAAMALGYYHGRKGAMPEKYKVPLDAAAGVALTFAGLFGGKYLGGEKVTRHLTALGSGAMAYFFGSLGGQFGQKARFAAKELVAPPGAYLTGNDKDTSAAWRNSRTITAGGMPYAGPAPVGYADAWRRG